MVDKKMTVLENQQGKEKCIYFLIGTCASHAGLRLHDNAFVLVILRSGYSFACCLGRPGFYASSHCKQPCLLNANTHLRIV